MELQHHEKLDILWGWGFFCLLKMKAAVWHWFDVVIRKFLWKYLWNILFIKLCLAFKMC